MSKRNKKMNLKEKLSLEIDLQNIDFIKGVYKDNVENRKLGRVGSKYGGKESKDENKGNKNPIKTNFGIVLVKFKINDEVFNPSDKMLKLVKSELNFRYSLSKKVKMSGVLIEGFRSPISWELV